MGERALNQTQGGGDSEKQLGEGNAFLGGQGLGEGPKHHPWGKAEIMTATSGKRGRETAQTTYF